MSPPPLPASPRVFRSTRVVTPAGVLPATVHVTAGTISRVGAHDDVPAGAELVEAGQLALLPGLVDTHVHINEPGRTEWEGFETATRAAAAGGVTTLVDMPLNSTPPTISARQLRLKRAAAAGRCWVDTGFWGGVVPGNRPALPGLEQAGGLGFKCFLCPSGVDDFAHVGEFDLREAMPVIAGLGSVLLAHAEAPEVLASAPPARGAAYRSYLSSRPPAAEVAAIELLAGLCREYRTRIHVVHVTSAEAVEALRRVRAEGLPITAETCPHYLFFAAEEIPDGATVFKCAPPIREQIHREALWRALLEGVLDMIASDHAPCPPELKRLQEGDFAEAWGGISSLQLQLPVVWTAAQGRGAGLERIARWMSETPARLAGLSTKGAIEPGRDADLVCFDPEAEFEVRPEEIRHRHRLTPYARLRLRGRVRRTFLRGEEIGDVPAGRLLPAPPAPPAQTGGPTR